MNNKIKKYLTEVSLLYDLIYEEVEALFLQSVGEVYIGLGSYVNNDGTVLIAKSKENGEIYLKHYVVSAKMYEKIDASFKNLVQKYAFVKSAEKFIFTYIGKVVNVKVIKITEKNIYVTPVLEAGSALGYKFVLRKNKCFYNEKLEVGDEIKVIYERVLRKEKLVQVKRFNRLVCEAIFKELFHKLINVVEEDYEFTDVNFLLDFKKKRVLIFVKWKRVPTFFFRKYLENELKNVFGKCKLLIKKRRGKNERD